jgi:hypothetical protein
MRLNNTRIGQPPVPATQNEPSTDYRFAAFVPTGPDRPSRTVTTWPRRLSRAENAGCSASRPPTASGHPCVGKGRIDAPRSRGP